MTGLDENDFDHVLALVQEEMKKIRMKNWKKKGLNRTRTISLRYVGRLSQNLHSFSLRAIASDLSPRYRLVVVLYWLRHYPSYRQTGILFHISQSSVQREVVFLLPVLSAALQFEIKMPDWQDVEPGFAGAQFAIDCTPHFRNRVHPCQHLYYRGDKHAHFLTAQVSPSF